MVRELRLPRTLAGVALGLLGAVIQGATRAGRRRGHDSVRFLGLGPIGAMKVLDDLKKYLG